MRTLESQRETDHAWLLRLSQYVEGVAKDNDVKAETQNTKLCEMDRHLREFTASGLRFQQDLTLMKASFKELDGIIDAKLTGAVETGISAALERVVSSTQSSFLTLEGMLAAEYGNE